MQIKYLFGKNISSESLQVRGLRGEGAEPPPDEVRAGAEDQDGGLGAESSLPRTVRTHLGLHGLPVRTEDIKFIFIYLIQDWRPYILIDILIVACCLLYSFPAETLQGVGGTACSHWRQLAAACLTSDLQLVHRQAQ